MEIQSGNILLVESERMRQTGDQAGGRMSGRIIADGQQKNIFNPLSDLDAAYGDVAIEKVYVSIDTDGTETYYGANAAIAKPPSDPLVSCSLFTTRSWTDTRGDAKDRIEAYLARGPRYEGYFYDWHTAGQRALLMLADISIELPGVGATLAVVYDPGLATEAMQYVRVTRVSSVVRTFQDDRGSFQAQVQTLEISDPLEKDIQGGQPSRTGDRGQNVSAKLYTTVVADAGSYYAVAPLAEAVSLGALSVRAQTIFTQLVPSAQSEIPIADAKPHQDAANLTAAASAPVTVTSATTWSTTVALHLGQGCFPGTLSVTNGVLTVTDQGGRLLAGGAEVGAVDYVNGILTLTQAGLSIGGTKNASFIPAAAPIRGMQTASWAVTPETRSGTLATILTPPPAPGTCAVHFMAQGKWYVLRDDGGGALRGADTSYGSGSVSASSGSLVASFGALPDVGSTLIVVYGSRSLELDRSGGQAPVGREIQLTNPAGVPGSYILEWTDGTTLRSAQDDGAGALTGDAVGSVDYRANKVKWYPKRLPAGGADLEIAYDFGTPLSETFTNSPRNPDGTITVQLANGQVRPGQLKVTWNLEVDGRPEQSTLPWDRQTTRTVRDDGVGGLEGVPGAVVNYSTGTLTWNPDGPLTLPVEMVTYIPAGTNPVTGLVSCWKKVISHIAYMEHVVHHPTMATDLIDGVITVEYRAADSPQGATETVLLDTLEADLTPGFAEQIVYGSARLSYAGKVLVDRYGRLDQDIDPATGSGLAAGSLDVVSGRATLSVWQPGATTTGYASVQALLTTMGQMPVDGVTFRTASAPLRPASFLMLYQLAGDTQIHTATANLQGEITGHKLKGLIDIETGVVQIRFGDWVTAAGNEAEPWYHAGAIDDQGKIRVPAFALADSIRYAAVAYAYIPLDASILGIDAVRLPTDGRVPFIRKGDLVLVHNTQTITGSYVAGNQVTLRERTACVKVMDSTGAAAVNGTHYTVDLDAGVLTILSVAGLSNPLTIEHRLEDMALASDVQISGLVTLTRQISHDFPVEGSYVSSVLVFDDLQAQATPPFDQQTWTNEWQDYRLGNDTTANYNDVLFPVEVQNNGAITERWALIFTSTTAFRVVGEKYGQIGVGSINEVCEPVNPATGWPFFRVRYEGWGTGWATGNVLRFNTVGANYPMYLIRTTRMGILTEPTDDFTLLIRGNRE
jgi:hypothetical protein